MAITLTQEITPGRTSYYGGETFILASGKALKIETSSPGEEILDQEVPANKTWDVTINVYVKESDA